MARSNLGAVRLPLLAAAVLAYFSVSLSAQVVERGRTFADLTASHPCASGLTDRIARVTDCDAAGTIGDGGGAFQCWAYCDGSAPWADIAIGGSAGGGAATAVEGSATLPATCAEKDLYQDTDSGGTEFYICTATDTWTKTGTGSGTIGGTLTATDNLVCRTDGTGGSTIQASPLSLSDVSGVTTTVATITPAATTGASVAGQSMAFTASPAVASTDTAGAAAGGGFTFNTGAAARNASGNADGGTFAILPGAGIGTGIAGKIGLGVSAPFYNVGIEGKVVVGDGDQGNDGNAQFTVATSSTYVSGTTLSGVGQTWWPAISVTGVNGFSWAAGIGPINGGGLAIISRDLSDIYFGGGGTSGTTYTRMITSGTNAGLIVQSGWISTYGKNALTADYTNATATMSNLTALTTTLVAARKYTFRMVLRFSNSTAADGIMVDFDGGTATATDFGVNCQVFDTALLLSADTTALATDIVVTTATGASKMVCDGSFTVNAAGTFIPRAAEEADGGGTLTVELGSHLIMEDVSFN